MAQDRVELIKLTREEAAHLRPQLYELLLHAERFADGEFETEDILDFAEKGLMQAWVVGKGSLIKAAMITDIAQYPRIRVLRIVAVAGAEFDEWKHLYDSIESYARIQGCARVEATMRPGMAKRSESIGFKRSRILMTKYVFGVTH